MSELPTAPPHDCDSSPERSPRRSWRTSSLRPRGPPVSQGQQRSSSRRSRRPVPASQPRPDRDQPGTPSSRPVDARGQSAPPSGRDRSPIRTVATHRSRQEIQPPRTVIARAQPSRARTPSPKHQRAPSSQLTSAATSRELQAPQPEIREVLMRPTQAPTLQARATTRQQTVAPLPLMSLNVRTPPRSPSPQPGTSSGIRHTPPQPYLIPGSSESTLTAPSPAHRSRRTRSPSPEVVVMGPPPARDPRAKGAIPKRPRPPETLPPARTPPRREPEPLQLPRTPGFYSSPEDDPGLDITRYHRAQTLETDSVADEDSQWDQYSTSTVPAASLNQLPSDETPLSWLHVVDLVYQSGFIDNSTLPPSPEPVRSVIGGPQAAPKRKQALPPSPLVAASLPSAMKSCWGGTCSSHAQHQPPPPNAALHPVPASWVPEFKFRHHAGPGLDLRPARLSAREKEWAGTAQPPVGHAWLVDVESLARAQLTTLSNLEWLFAIFLDSSPRASPLELETLRGFIVRELQLAANFGGAQIATATLGRRQAILDSLQHRLHQTTRNWLQLQPVELKTTQGLFGPASALVPDIMRQQPVPRATNQNNRRRAARPQRRREPARENPAPQAPPPPARAPAATYTPTAAAAPAPPRAQNRPRGRGGQQPSARGARAPRQQP